MSYEKKTSDNEMPKSGISTSSAADGSPVPGSVPPVGEEDSLVSLGQNLGSGSPSESKEVHEGGEDKTGASSKKMKVRKNEPDRDQTAVDLVWPPTKEDLERLYVQEHLSAMKISKLYGLKYPNPKSGEVMILHYLNKWEIKRRDPAEHSRKGTKEVVDEWVRRYEAGESLKDIAGKQVNHVTVYNHLHKRGIKLRDKVEAQIKAVTKFQRMPFKGSVSDRTYLLGFVWGDCSAEKHGRAVRVRSGTTHPEFVELFKSLFGRYGHIRMYPKLAKITPAEWNLQVDLDGSFEFLLEKNIRPIPEKFGDRKTLMSFLAGFTDAEGSIYFHRNSHSSGFEVQISNSNLDLLRRIQDELVNMDYHPRLYVNIRTLSLEPLVKSEVWKLSFFRSDEVNELLVELPLRHNEKVTKARLALAFMNSERTLDSSGTPPGWNEYIAEIKQSCQAFIHEAVQALNRGA